MASEKNIADGGLKPSKKPTTKKTASGKKKSISTEKKTPKKASLSVRVVSKKTIAKDSHEEDILDSKKEAKHSEKKEENREFFKRAEKKTEKEDVKKKEVEEKKNEERKEKEKAKTKTRVQPKSIGLYRKISLFFIALTVLLLGSIFYFYFVSLTVEVVPKKERKSDNVSFVVRATGATAPANKESIEGAVEQIPIKEDGKFQATGAEILGREITGKAIIYNNKGDKQVLIATTRLMSPEGKIYRIKDRVEIAPNGNKEVEIYTDEPSEEMAIGPTRFTLPALWAGLQDKVYAESKTAFVYNTQVKKFVQQIDIDKGLQDLKASMVDKVGRQFGDNYKGFDRVIFEIDKNSLVVNPSAKANDPVDEFTISLNAKVNVVAFKKSEAERLAEEKFLSKAPVEKKVLGLETSETEYSLASTDFSSGQAVIDASFVGFLSARKGDTLVEREKIIGLNEDQIRDYLTRSDNFSDFKINFSPSFMKKAPALVDRIKIIIKD